MIRLDGMPKTQLFTLPILLAITLTVGSCSGAMDPELEPAATAPPATTAQAEKTEADTDQKDVEQAPATVILPTLTPQETTAEATKDATNEPAAENQSENGQTEVVDESLAGAGEQADASSSENEGLAAYMSDNFHGQATASGIIFDKDAMMAAHKSLPFGSEVVVTNPKTGKSVTVTIVDRLPERAETIIDVSSAAAAELDMFDSGMVWVVLEPVGP